MDKTRVYTPEEFQERLRRDELGAQLTLTGMVKPHEDSATHIEFTPGTKCGSWVSVPLDLIERVEVLDSVECGEHAHPLVTLTFKEPETAEGKVFKALLKPPARKMMVKHMGRRPPGGPNPASAHRQPVKSVPSYQWPDEPWPWPCEYGPWIAHPHREKAEARQSCADVCNTYEIDEHGHVYELWSCQTYGSGDYAAYACYYH